MNDVGLGNLLFQRASDVRRVDDPLRSSNRKVPNGELFRSWRKQLPIPLMIDIFGRCRGRRVGGVNRDR